MCVKVWSVINKLGWFCFTVQPSCRQCKNAISRGVSNKWSGWAPTFWYQKKPTKIPLFTVPGLEVKQSNGEVRSCIAGQCEEYVLSGSRVCREYSPFTWPTKILLKIFVIYSLVLDIWRLVSAYKLMDSYF